MECNKVEYEYFDNGNIKNEYWYNEYGRLNRTDGPAIILYYLNGNKRKECWLIDDEYHRIDGPAKVFYNEDGSKKCEFWFKNDMLHRENGPSSIFYSEDGYFEKLFWYQNDEIHRIDGPAAIEYDKSHNIIYESYFLNGKKIDNELQIEVLKELNKQSCPNF